jgi:hypothetical protein
VAIVGVNVTSRAIQELLKVFFQQSFTEIACLKQTRLTDFRLGGVVVSVLSTGPKGRGFKPGRDDGFLRAIKNRITPSFGGEVKPEVPCRKILRNVKYPLTYQRY